MEIVVRESAKSGKESQLRTLVLVQSLEILMRPSMRSNHMALALLVSVLNTGHCISIVDAVP